MSRNIIVVVIALVLLVILSIVVASLIMRRQGGLVPVIGTPVPTPTPMVTPGSPLPTPSDLEPMTPTPLPKGGAVQGESWQRYTSNVHHFSITHPSDVRVDTREAGFIQFSKWGPTQSSTSQFTDGINVLFNSGSLQNRALRDIAVNKVEQVRNSAATRRIGEITQTQIAGRQAYTFEVEAQGNRRYYYLPGEQGRYLEIIDATTDPTGQGYSQTVNSMFSTLEII